MTKTIISCARLMNCLRHFNTIADTEYIFIWQKAVGRGKKAYGHKYTDKAMNLRPFPSPPSSPFYSQFLPLEESSDK